MKIRLVKLAIIACILFLLCGCFSEAEERENENSPSKKFDPVESILEKMTLEEKIGQMMMVGVYGKDINDDIRFMLNQYHFGGVILYDRNMDSKVQVKNFTENLQGLVKNFDKKIPLFIAIDEEGGRVSRMKHDLIPPPSQEEIGTSGNYDLAKATAISIADELSEIGINLNFAPVADVGSNDTRSFSDDANVVAKFVDSAAQGYEEENFFYCLKHFPGIGRGKVDTHKDISTVETDKTILYATDMLPFKETIAEHDNSKFMIMVGHLKYTALDSDNAASLSKKIITDILRNEFNFQGVIISDDLDMGAVSNYSEIEPVSLQTIKSGVDVVLICHEYELQKRAYEAILDAVKRGEISEDRINQSVKRVLKMKLSLSE